MIVQSKSHAMCFCFTADVDECAENTCAQECVNSPGSYSCYCDGKKGFKLSKDRKNCEVKLHDMSLLGKLQVGGFSMTG